MSHLPEMLLVSTGTSDCVPSFSPSRHHSLRHPLPGSFPGAIGWTQAHLGQQDRRTHPTSPRVTERPDGLISGCLLASPSAQPGHRGPAGLVPGHL